MRGACWMAFLVTMLAAPWRAQAAVSWLTVRGTCAADIEQLARRIEQEVAGQRPSELSLTLEIDAGAPTRGRLWLTQGERVVGEKQVEARSCEAALDLLTAVGALALSAPAIAPPIGPEGEAHEAVHALHAGDQARAAHMQPGTPRPGAARVEPDARQDGDPIGRTAPPQRWRLLATAGVALGASAPTTVLVTGGAALSWGPGELRLLGRYGLPSTTEEIEVGARGVRIDFGAAALDYCYGLDRGRWLSLCGGLELLTRRERRTSEDPQQGRLETTRRDPLLGPSAGLLVVLRRVVAQPQLELSALMPVWGAPPGFGFRAALGGGLPF